MFRVRSTFCNTRKGIKLLFKLSFLCFCCLKLLRSAVINTSINAKAEKRDVYILSTDLKLFIPTESQWVSTSYSSNTTGNHRHEQRSEVKHFLSGPSCRIDTSERRKTVRAETGFAFRGRCGDKESHETRSSGVVEDKTYSRRLKCEEISE